MPPIHTALFASGLLLQFALLLLLFHRRIAFQVIPFTLLIFFYSIRSALLSVLLHFTPRPVYAQASDAFSLLEIVLQLGVAFELTRSILHRSTHSTSTPHVPKSSWALPGLLLLASGLLTSGLLTALLAHLLPSRSPAPADRAALFCGFLFVQLFALTRLPRIVPIERPQSSILAGLAAIGTMNLVAQSARSIAGFHRNLPSFLRWSYATIAVYLLVLLYWLVCCRPESRMSVSSFRRQRDANECAAS